MIAESLTTPGTPILWGVTCIGMPAAAIWVRTVGVTRICCSVSACIWAFGAAWEAGKARYAEVYVAVMTGTGGR